MGVTGSLYNGDNFKAVALYNEHPDVYSAIPKPMTGRHVMHVRYSYENHNGSFDVYLVDHMDATNFDKKKTLNTINHSHIIQDDVFYNQNVHLETVSDIKGTSVEKDLERMAGIDIALFCKEHADEKGTSKIYTDMIIPKTKIHFTKPKYMIKAGKSEFVPSCLLDANLDFSAGCITGFVPMQGASFSDNTFIGFYHDRMQECDYCYAMDKHKIYPKTFTKINKKKLKEELLGNFEDYQEHIVGKPQRYLRFGKRTEAGAIYNRPQLIDSLEVMCDTKTRGIMPTKFLEYDKIVAGLLKKTNSIILTSIGKEEMENGARMHFRSDEERIESAIKYHEAGVLSGIYLMHDFTEPLDEKKKRFVEDITRRGMPIQLLATRILHSDLAIPMTGKPWYILNQGKTQTTLEGRTSGGYSQEKNHSLIAEYVHPDVLSLIGDNNGDVRACHHNKQTTWCGSCFMRKGFAVKTVTPRLKPINKYKKKPKEMTLKLDLFNTNKNYDPEINEIDD